MSDSLVSSGAGLVALAVVARVLGPEEYGSYAYVFALAQIFAVLGQMGLGALLARELLDKPDDQPRTLGTAGGLRGMGFVLGGLGLLFYGLVLFDHSAEEHWLFVAAAIYVTLSSVPIMLDGWFKSRVEARYSAIAGISGNLLSALGKIAAVTAGLGVIVVGFIQAASIAVTSLLMVLFFWRREGPAFRSWKFDPRRAWELLGESSFVFLGSILAVIYLKIDVAMLRWMADTDSVGLYAVSARLSEVFYFVPLAIVASVVPSLVQLRKTDAALFDRRFQDLLRVLALLAYLFLVSVLVVGPFILVLVFGEAYRAAIPVLMVHALSMPFIFLRSAFSPWIVIVKFAKFSLVSQGVGALVNVGLNLALIPPLGMMGAAIATLVSYAGASYLALLLSTRTRPVFAMMTRAFLMPWEAFGALNTLRKGGLS